MTLREAVKPVSFWENRVSDNPHYVTVRFFDMVHRVSVDVVIDWNLVPARAEFAAVANQLVRQSTHPIAVITFPTGWEHCA